MTAALLPEGWESWPVPARKKLLARLKAEQARRASAQAAAAYARRLEETAVEADARLRLITGFLYDPVGWVDMYVGFPAGQGLTAYQREILTALPRERRAVIRGPHGLGKSALAALVILWFAETRHAAGIDWKIPTTAGAWRQLTKFLWPEIGKWAGRLRWDLLGRPPYTPRELLTLSLKLRGGEAFAVASDDPALIEGAHADSILYVFDEGKAIQDPTWDAAEGAFSAASAGRGLPEAFALALSTPGAPQGRFYDLSTHQAGYEDWWARHVTLEEAIAAGRIQRSWAEQRAKQWAASPGIYANRVLGEFHADDEMGIVPSAWVDAAVERWKSWAEAGRPDPGPLKQVGVDVAGEGEQGDRTCLALRHENDEWNVVTELRMLTGDTVGTAGRVLGLLEKHKSGTVEVDLIGIGTGVYDQIREAIRSGFYEGEPRDYGKARVNAFVASGKTRFKDTTGEISFNACRSAAWWNLREMLDPAQGPTLALPDDPELIGDLTAPRWREVAGGKIQVEAKDEIRKRIGRSTDKGDAVMQSVWSGGRAVASIQVPE